jgi:adenylate cyclase
MAAYECVLAAKVLHHRSIREDNAEAQRLLDRALALDPNYAHAHAWKACVAGPDLGLWMVRGSRRHLRSRWPAELEIALALDDNDSDVHRILAALKPERATIMTRPRTIRKRALALNPTTTCCGAAGRALDRGWGGRRRASTGSRRRCASTQYHPERFWSHLGRAFYCAEKYAEAAEAFRGSHGLTTRIMPFSRPRSRGWVTGSRPPRTRQRF